MIHHEVCGDCPNSHLGYDEHLTPVGVGGGMINAPIACRHLTCDLGLAQATRALRHHILEYGTIVHPVAFGSTHKPIGTRYVDASGAIFFGTRWHVLSDRTTDRYSVSLYKLGNPLTHHFLNILLYIM